MTGERSPEWATLPHASRYEIMPFAAAEAEALRLTQPVTLTVTCSPRQGVDETVDVATRLAAHGHDAVPHLAARQVRGTDHLDELLARIAEAGIRDVFVIGGDASEPLGPYPSAVAVLDAIAEHRHRPGRIGIGAYPEGHPLIDPPTLQRALAEKAQIADYVVTQLCFDPRQLIAWMAQARAAGLVLPIYAGVPGAVDRKRLLEISVRVGVGASVSFLRKQHGLRRLFSSPTHATERLHAALVPRLGDTGLGLAGLHWYTFNRLEETLRFEHSSPDGSRHFRRCPDGCFPR